MSNTAKNQNKNVDPNGDPDFSTFTDEQIGFAPYWNPETGKEFYGALVARDERDPEFVRYLVMNLSNRPLACSRGPADNAEEVLVQKGETFSISVYHQLREAFDFYLDVQSHKLMVVPMRLIAQDKVKTASRNEVWRFKLQVPMDVKKKLDAIRHELRAQLTQSSDERKAIQENS